MEHMYMHIDTYLFTIWYYSNNLWLLMRSRFTLITFIFHLRRCLHLFLFCELVLKYSNSNCICLAGIESSSLWWEVLGIYSMKSLRNYQMEQRLLLCFSMACKRKFPLNGLHAWVRMDPISGRIELKHISKTA